MSYFRKTPHEPLLVAVGFPTSSKSYCKPRSHVIPLACLKDLVLPWVAGDLKTVEGINALRNKETVDQAAKNSSRQPPLFPCLFSSIPTSFFSLLCMHLCSSSCRMQYTPKSIVSTSISVCSLHFNLYSCFSIFACPRPSSLFSNPPGSRTPGTQLLLDASGKVPG